MKVKISEAQRIYDVIQQEIKLAPWYGSSYQLPALNLAQVFPGQAKVETKCVCEYISKVLNENKHRGTNKAI